jgi:hypothetical protein
MAAAPFNENFGLTVDNGQPETNGDIRDVVADCNLSGTESSFSFTVSGTASGSYPGTYTETATATFSHEPGTDQVAGPLTAYDATFTVTSGSTTVHGEKHLSATPGVDATGTCSGTETAFHVSATTIDPADIRYSATIDSPDGRFGDEGNSAVQVGTGYSQEGVFFEYFLSDLSEARPLLPTSEDQCKKGGWKQYGVFKNQGDCVSFVATHGKNPPSGP